MGSLLVILLGLWATVVSAEPFGLQARHPMTGIQLPDQPVISSRYNIIEAFSQLTFHRPLFLTQAPGDSSRVFLLEQSGKIRVFENKPDVSHSKVFLDMSSAISVQITPGMYTEEGLLGLAFSPDYQTTGYFYVNYTAKNPRRTVVARYRVSSDPDVADANSAEIILEQRQPYSNHNGGMMVFGPDGYLYIGMGDGGWGGDPEGNGQNRETLLGAILRVDPRGGKPYAIPKDNPFVASRQVRSEIWAYGLRNPWRFSFDRETGALWVGDVGQDTYEEIDVVTGGNNLGWNLCEGLHRFRSSNPCPTNFGFTMPVFEYPRSQGGSVTGGYVYRGTELASLRGAYVFGDFMTRHVWALIYNGNKVTSHARLGTLPPGQGVASFGELNNGELIIVGHGDVGRLYQLEERTGGTSVDFPAKLSQTGLFEDTATLKPHKALIEYDVKVPLWSDGALKKRWVAVPLGSTVKFDATQPWEFPVGTVLVKHFEVPDSATTYRRLETRVLLHQKTGWAGVTYRWEPSQRDAKLLTDYYQENISVWTPQGTRLQNWQYPSRSQCFRCHTSAAGYVLGVRTHQLNSDFPYPSTEDNQLRSWDHVGLFHQKIGGASQYAHYPDLEDTSEPVAQRARAYLAVNCAQCHQKGSFTPGNMDMRFETALDQMKLVDTLTTQNQTGLPLWRIKSGDHAASTLWHRMRRLDGTRMPPLGSTVVDESAIELIGEWIDGL